MKRLSACFCRCWTSHVAYSFAAAGSWIEHGPTTTSSRERVSVPRTMETAVAREEITVDLEAGV